MTIIEMNVDIAKMNSEALTNVIHNLEDCRKLLISKCDSLTAVWQSGSAIEFHDLHETQMNILWSKIQRLIQLNNDLDAAIAIAKQVDQNFGGG
jgi:ribosomal 50S subunit-associated protein YjgA (DUF615 family)